MGAPKHRPNSNWRKLIAFTGAEDAAETREGLAKGRVFSRLNIWKRKHVDAYYVFVHVTQLEKAREILRDSRREVKG
jgi:hypothetical protein